MTAEFDFDTPVDRHATGSYKWDSIGDREVIPLWVARPWISAQHRP